MSDSDEPPSPRRRMANALRRVPPDYLTAIGLLQEPREAAREAVQGVNTRRQTLLHVAARDDACDVAALALARGAAPGAADITGATPLRACCHSGGPSLDVARLLLRQAGVLARTGARGSDGWSVLDLAAYFGFADFVRLLLDTGGMDPNARASSGSVAGETPLHIAAGMPHDRTDVLQVFMDFGANHTLVNGAGLTPLDLAVVSGHPANVQFLTDLDNNPGV